MRILALFLLLFAAISLSAQPKQNSPYSRYGIGDLLPQHFANNAGWGGMTAAFHDPFHLNFQNPASFAHLRTTTLETGLYAKASKFSQNPTGSTLNTWSGNLAYLALGFTLKSPINEVLDKQKSPWKYGMGIALTPYSLVGYDIATANNLSSGVDSVKNVFQGNGGTYKFNWAGAAKYKETSFGASLGWMFGQMVYENTTSFFDSVPTFQNNFRDDINVRGLVWNIGVQHDFILKRDPNDKEVSTEWLTVGITGESKHRLKEEASQIRLRSRGLLINGQYDDADTLLYRPNAKEKLVLPAAFSAGLMYVKANKLKLGAQFGYEGWSGYEHTSRPETFRNTFSVAGGVEYIPLYNSYNRFFKRVRYRAGAYFRQDPRTVAGKNFDDYGVTLGLGLPIVLPRQQTSFINAALEIGKLGESSAIEEFYYRITLGFTLNDNTWFYKRRFE
jgi:hypothetical protein